jgi:hypothetical protein
VPPAVALFNYWTLKRSCKIFADLFPNWVFSHGFIFILLILPIGTAKAFLGGALPGAHSVPFFLIKSLKRRVRASAGRALAAKTY